MGFPCSSSESGCEPYRKQPCCYFKDVGFRYMYACFSPGMVHINQPQKRDRGCLWVGEVG